MLKFKFKSEEGAREAKRYIKETAELLDFMTLSEVISNYGMPIESTYPLENAANVGWRWSDLKGRNIFVKQVRRTWYLYLCEPTLNVNDISKPQDDYCPKESVSDDLDDETKMLINYIANMIDGRRPVKVTRHFGDVEKIAYGLWSCWIPNSFTSGSSTVTKLLGVVEFEDGHIEWVEYKCLEFLDKFNPFDWFYITLSEKNEDTK